ncbi:tetratricopeptide repeat protein [Ferrovibrio sp.]|uniref:tetratricopeptide repeat protein n=1 Tax=Ferrovibrio sp. TaxID=1917215 RepID=UPI0026256FE6|nr:tetratricopeptide repeat protein [Ferrovibrio sp.]
MASPERISSEAAQSLRAGVAAHQAGKLDAAEALYRAVLALNAEQPDALHLLGVIADQRGKHVDAVDLIRRAIAGSPDQAVFHGNLGTALYAMGDAAAAESAYRRALSLDASYADAHANLGNLLAGRGDYVSALDSFRAALTAVPGHPAAQRGMIAALLSMQNHAKAVRVAATAVQAEPQAADLRDLAALALRGERQYDKALAQHRKALALAPDELAYREHYAVTLVAMHRVEAYREAVAEFETILARDPDRLDSLIGLGVALIRSQRPAAALQPLQRAIARDGNHVEALINYATALAYVGRIEEAVACGERAFALAPDDCMVLCLRGGMRAHIGDFDGALADFAAAQAARQRRMPEWLADAALNHALLLLSLGRLSEGWPSYAARMASEHADPRGMVISRLLPAWDGVVRQGQRILVWGEQGVGDQVIYASMLPDLKARGADFLFVCDHRLVPLFRRSFPEMRTEPAAEGELPALATQADVQVGLGSLGQWLRPNLAAFPPPQAYLRPDPEQVETFRRRYQAHGRRAVIGLTWRSRNMRSEAYKSIPLLDWAPLLRQRDVLFVDMQYGDTTEDRHAVREALGVDILHDDSVDALNDLDRFAAQAAALDLMIGGSNSGLHIAAATGQETWALLPGGSGRLWYWFLGRDDSPWYPHLRLFRQRPGGRSDDWQAVIAQLAQAFEAWLSRSGR